MSFLHSTYRPLDDPGAAGNYLFHLRQASVNPSIPNYDYAGLYSTSPIILTICQIFLLFLRLVNGNSAGPIAAKAASLDGGEGKSGGHTSFPWACHKRMRYWLVKIAAGSGDEGSDQEVTGAPESESAGDPLSRVMLGSASGHVSQEISRSKIAFSARVTASEALFLKLTNRWRCAIR